MTTTSTNFAPESFTTFGALLLYLRRRARLRQRDLAIATGYSEAQIGRLENNQRTPDVTAVMAQFIPALDISDAPELAARLVQLAHSARASSTDADVPVATPVGDAALSVLPAPATPIIGRAAERAELARLLAAPGVRCVTLTGPGGVGKTRLALQVAHDLAPQFGAVCVATLAGVDSATALPLALAQALRLRDVRDANAMERLCVFLGEHQTLLVLDNFEHLLDGVEYLAKLSEAAPGLRLLVTSRERLHVWGEVVLTLSGLPLPNDTQADGEAAQLFVASARRARYDFAPTGDDLAAITRICGTVEGLPLGIELAAAWVGLCSCAEIEAELRGSLDFLQTTAHGVPERHRSLRAAFEYSWHLFSTEERRVLARLTVFRGGFTRAAAEAVCESDAAPNSSPQLLFTLAALVDKSVLWRADLPGSSRYTLHELVRQFAAERLANAAEQQAAYTAHSQYYLALLATHEAALKGPLQQTALATLLGELDNLRAAIQWAIDTTDIALLRRALPGLVVLFEWQSIVREGEATFAQIVARLRETLPAASDATFHQHTFGLALTYHGWFTFNLGQSEAARVLLCEGAELLADSEDQHARGDAQLLLGVVTGELGDVSAGIRIIRASLAHFAATNNQWCLARALYRLALLLLQNGEYVVAQHLLADSARRISAQGDQRVAVFILNRLGTTAALLGQHDEAQRILQQNLLHGTAIGDQRGTAMTLYHIGRTAQDVGDHHVARYCLSESLDVFVELGDQWSAAQALAQIAYSAAAERDLSAAQAASASGWQIVRSQNMVIVALDLLIADAARALADEQAGHAAMLLTLVIEHSASGQINRDRAARLLRAAAAALTPYAFAAARGRGQALTLEAHTLLPVSDNR